MASYFGPTGLFRYGFFSAVGIVLMIFWLSSPQSKGVSPGGFKEKGVCRRAIGGPGSASYRRYIKHPYWS